MADTDPAGSDPLVDPRERQRQLDQSRIDTFVVRARRIEAHSLAQDREQLLRLANGPMNVTYNPGGKSTIRFYHPPEEQVESAAARVRPLLLDDVSMLSVLKSIKSLTAKAPDRDAIKRWSTATRRQWNSRTGKTPSDSGFLAYYESTATRESAETNHVELALAWIYGDVVHHDPEHIERTKLWGVGERFRAAAPLVAYLMHEALSVLACIRELEKLGRPTVSPEAWNVPVIAEEFYEVEVDMYLGEVGTTAPGSAGEPFGEGWEPLGPNSFDGTEIDRPAGD